MHRQRANAIVVQQGFLDGKGESIQFNALTDSCDIITGQVFCQFFINIYSLDSGIVLGSYGVPFALCSRVGMVSLRLNMITESCINVFHFGFKKIGLE